MFSYVILFVFKERWNLQYYIYKLEKENNSNKNIIQKKYLNVHMILWEEKEPGFMLVLVAELIIYKKIILQALWIK